ncbi:MAG TPA: transposase [Burkholderiales bacterium]|nr:transposase [Burkholderiales bacterium]
MHIRQRGNDGQDCFRHENDRLVYLINLHELCAKVGCALHAYCLMTNHVHLLMTPPAEGACGTLMRELGQRYVQYFNRRHERTGTLWEGRFRSCLVESREYVLWCHRYIEMNPVRAGLAPQPSAYRWSSHEGNVGSSDNPLLRPHAEYTALAEEPAARQAAYRRMFDGQEDPAFLAAIRNATTGGYALVGAELKSKLVGNARHRLEPGKAGRRPTEAADAETLSLELGL